MRNSRLKIVSPVLLLYFMLFVSGYADNQKQDIAEKDEKKEQIVIHPREEIVVTATMTRKAVKELTASVSVIKAEDIEAIPASNALQLINYTPGAFISQTGYFGRADLNIRGLGERGRKIAILVDGRPEKMSLFGCLISHTFPLDNVERIEVVRGPSSVLYGSEALGGVVNVMTHMPVSGFETDVSASYGSFDTRQFTLKHGGVVRKISYFLTADMRSSDGHRENSGYTGNALTGKVKYSFSDYLKVSLQGKYYTGKKYEAGPVDLPLADFWNDYERGALDFTLQGLWKEDEIHFKLYRNFGRHKFSDGWDSRDHINGGVFRYTTHRISNNELTIGGDFRFLWGKSTNFPVGEWDKSEAAVFVQDHYVLTGGWILTAGLRFHWDSLFGFEPNPQVGFVYHASDFTSIRGTISKGFRSPQLNELYMYPPANPELKPERVWNYEVGFDQHFGDWLSLGAALFYMKGSNLVEQVGNTAPPPMFKFRNTGEFTFTGAEFSMQAAFFENLTGIFNYSSLNPGDFTKGRPGHKLDCSLRFRRKAFYAALNANYVADYYTADFSSSPLPNYFIANFRLALNVSSAVKVFADLNNIFDKNYLIYVELPGVASGSYPMPGRNLIAGIRIKH